MYYNPMTGKSSHHDNFHTDYIPVAQQNQRTPVHARAFAQTHDKVVKEKKRKQENEKRAEKNVTFQQVVVMILC